MFYKRIDDKEWIYLGETPLKTRIPRGYINFKISKPGYVDYLSLTSVWTINNLYNSEPENYYQLTPISDEKENMIKIPGGKTKNNVYDMELLIP